MYENSHHQQGAWEDYELPDEVPEDGIRRAIGNVQGTEASGRIEQLLGVYNPPQVEDDLRCEEGSSSVMVRFRVSEGVDRDWLEREDAIIANAERDDQNDADISGNASGNEDEPLYD